MEKNYTLLFRRFLKIALRVFGVLVVLVVIFYLGLAFYIHTHKKEVLASVTKTLNESVSGTFSADDMEVTLVQNFPSVSLGLKNASLHDSLYIKHKRPFLEAGEIDVAVNTLALLRGAVQIRKIDIQDAELFIYTDKSGYTNTSVFKKNKKAGNKDDGGSFPELKRLRLNNVNFTADNQKTNKLYKFTVNKLNAALKYNSDGFRADVQLNAHAHSMAFNTLRGSFIKGQPLNGSFNITYHEDESKLVFKKEHLKIGGEDFIIGAQIGVGASSAFAITIENKSILWEKAAGLLSPNISAKLMMFNISKPIDVSCDLVGDFNVQGDPLIRVNAVVRNNTLNTPGGVVDNCSFFGVFTNNRMASKGFDDANSSIKLFGLKGKYSGLPFEMPRVEIKNLEHPVAVGSVVSQFKMKQLSGLVDENLLKFDKGTASAKLNFKADVEKFKLVKPVANGAITVKDANVTYVPRQLKFDNISVGLQFNRDDLEISKVVLKTGKSIINMQGSIKNFLNLYYNDPQKVVLKWDINSPQLHMGEFMTFLQTRKKTQRVIRKNVKQKAVGLTADLDNLFEKSTVDMKIKVGKLFYKKFLATNASANILLSEKGNIIIKNAGLNHAGGRLGVNGIINPDKITRYNLSANVNGVDVSKFMYAFDNFGLESLSPQNLKGLFYARADVSGSLNQAGALVPRSVNGNILFTLKKGRLINFDPIVSVGKFAFPFRDVKDIQFKDLNGKLNLQGEKVAVAPMKISSSVLNMDIQGVYSFGKGTQLYIDVPLRNPEKDKDITDKKELEKRRTRGIVVHLVAEDDKDGKVKVKLGKKKS